MESLSAVQSAPNGSPVLRVLLDDDHVFRSPKQYPISLPNPSRLTPALPPPSPGVGTQLAPRFSPSPSPPQIRPTPSFPLPYSAPHHHTHFASSATSHPPNMDRYSSANFGDRYLRNTDKYPHNQHSILDQRRMSEPFMYGNPPRSYPANSANPSDARHHQFQHQYSYAPPQSHGVHSSPPRPSSHARSIGGSPWKEDHLPLHSYDPLELEEPLSPLDPTFSGGESPPPMGMSGMMFGSFHEDYGPSPPGTGTSTSSNPHTVQQQTHSPAEPSSASNNKQYAFVSLPGNVVKKRPRRRYDEIERLYQCSWQNCTKSYGTLNHLNAHITMQKHGSKRSPNEFKELRKQWRKAKKEEAETKTLDTARHGPHPAQHPLQQHPSPHPMSSADYQIHNIYSYHPARSVQPTGSLEDFHESLPRQPDVHPRRSHRYGPFVSPQPQHSGITYPYTHAHGVNTSNIPMNRLPANGTLLTPLSSYASSMVGTSELDAYDLYRSDSRPRAGHGSPVDQYDRGRPRSSHANSGAGHHRNYP